ncbi:MAG: hypothetical protein QOH90_1231 [Actinomycetota bacterium]|jgi:hypothetical protein|nr:hypothetical protein [Actinomycetota bacterium]
MPPGTAIAIPEPPASLDVKRCAKLEREITELAAHIHAATCRWLLLLAEFIEAGGWAVDGVRSPAHWLEWKCALAPRSARDRVQVALALKDLPETTAAFSEGRLSFSQVRAIARVATPEDEAHFVEIARFSTAGQLERVIATYRGFKRNQELEQANRRHEDRKLEWDHDEYGAMVITARLSPEDGLKVITALGDAARDLPTEEPDDGNGVGEPLGNGADEENGTAVPPKRRTSRRPLRPGPEAADALVLMAERSQAAAPRCRSGADRTLVTLHVDVDALVNDLGDRCDLDDVVGIPPETARRLACDCSVIEILEKDGVPLDVGRKTRKISTPMRRALEARDKTCVYPGCSHRHYVDGHHIRFWTRDQGETKLENLALLCWHHHRKVHEGGFSMIKDGDRFLFFRPDGSMVPEVSGMAAARGPNLERRNVDVGLAIDAETCANEWDGKPVNIDYVADSILDVQAEVARRVAS